MLKFVKSIFIIPLMIITLPLTFIIMIIIILCSGGWKKFDFKLVMISLKEAIILTYNELVE